MGKKLPKNCRDWHEDLLRCASARYNSRVRLRRKDYGEWMKAKELLNASRDPIYIQPTGQYKGQVVGIPKKIGPNIYQYLCDVVKEARPIIHPEDEAQPLADFNVLNPDGTVRPQVEQNEAAPQIESIPWVVDRKYRDSAYSILASMYHQLRPERHLQLKTSQVTSGMSAFTDLEIEYHWRTRKNGAFKAMDQLVDKGLVHKTKNGGFTGGNNYSLTRNGLRVCYYLFHVKFSPTANPTYKLVRPIGNCVATPEGNVQETDGHGVPRIPHMPNIPFGAGNGVGNVGIAGYNNNNIGDVYQDHMGDMFGGDFGYDEGNKYQDRDLYGSGAKKGNASGAKRSYDDVDNEGTNYTLDVDDVRNKRLKHFGHMATPIAKATTSSSGVKKALPTPTNATPTSYTHSSTHYSNTTTGYPTLYADANQTDSQVDELEEIQLQSILAYSEQEARLEALYREEQRMLELQKRALRGDGHQSADEEEEGEYEIRQEIYYKGLRVPDSADRRSNSHSATSAMNSSGASNARAYEADTCGNSAKCKPPAGHSKAIFTSEEEGYNTKRSANDHNYTNDNSSSSSNGAPVINLNNPTSSYDVSPTSYPTTSSSRSTTATPTTHTTTNTSSKLLANNDSSNSDSEDEDYRRAIAESMLTDSVVKNKSMTTSHTPIITKSIKSDSTNSTLKMESVALPLATSTLDTSLDDVVYVETPRKATSCASYTYTRTNRKDVSVHTPSRQSSARSSADTATREIITVLDESQEESQDISFYSPDTAREIGISTTTGIASKALHHVTSKSAMSTSGKIGMSSSASATYVETVDTPPSTCNTAKVKTLSTSSYTPLVATSTHPDVIELNDSQNDISINVSYADSPDIVILPAAVSASVVRSSAVKTYPSRSNSGIPEVRSNAGAGSAIANRPVTSAARSVLDTVLEINDTPPITATSNSSFLRDDVITLDDSQSPDLYPYASTNNMHNICTVASAEVYDLSLSPPYVSTTTTMVSTRTSEKVGSSKVSKSAAMLAAYATLTQPSPAVTNTSTTLNTAVAPTTTTSHKVTYIPVYLSTIPNTTITAQIISLPCNVIPFAPVPATANKLVLLVDVRERNKQATYRNFFYEIQAKCNTHLTLTNTTNTIASTTHGSGGYITEYSVEQDKLELGDITIAYDCDNNTINTVHTTSSNKRKNAINDTNDTEPDTSTYYLTGLVVERKSLMDLISSSAGDARSRCGTARHFVQECRMRHSGSKNAFMCIEGSMNVANIHAVPLVWRDRDYTHPDVIENVEGIVSYMCAVIGRNYSLHNVVRVVQTVNNSASCQLFAAMMAMEIYTANTSSNTPYSITTKSRATERTPFLPLKTDFDKYFRSMGASKRGKEADLRQSLQVPIAFTTPGFGNNNSGTGGDADEDGEVSEEMIERLVRRFGCWEALLAAYKECYTSQMADSNSNYDSVKHPVASTGDTSAYSTATTTSAEIRCMLMLCELAVGGTLSDRTVITTSNVTTGTVLLQDSLLVWQHARQMLCEEGFLQYHTTSGSSNAQSTSMNGRISSRAVLDPQVEHYLYSLHTSLLTILPHKVTHVTISAAMSVGILSQYSCLDSTDFVCQLLPPTATSTTTMNAPTDTLQPLSGRKRKSEVIPGGTCTYLNCSDQQYPYMYIQSVDTNDYTVGRTTSNSSTATVTARRCSLRTVVGIVSALDIVEAIIQSTTQYKLQHAGIDWRVVSVFADNHRSIEIISHATTAIAARLPVEFASLPNAHRDSSRGIVVPTQCVLIVEGLTHSTSPSATAMGKLENALNSYAGASNIIGRNSYGSSGIGSSSSGGGDTLTLGYGRPSLPVLEARDVSANQAWLVQLFVAFVSIQGLSRDSGVNTSISKSSSNEKSNRVGCQCFLTQNAEQTERFVYSLIHETHRQSLLLY